MKIRSERSGDIAAIRRVTTAAFLTARHSSGTEARIVENLRDAGVLTISLVAEVDGRIVGHVAFSPVTIPDAAGGWFGLGPVSVQPEHQGRGLGQALVRAGLERLQTAGAAGCVVLGEPEYYRRFGFESDPALTYGGASSPYFQQLVLRGPRARGEAAYHSAFEA